MSTWPSTKARRTYSALLRIGWQLKRRSGSHRTLSHEGRPDFVFAFHDDEELGPRILVRIAEHPGLRPEDLRIALSAQRIGGTGQSPEDRARTSVRELQRRIQEKLEFRFKPMQGLDSYQSIETMAEYIHDEVLAVQLSPKMAVEPSGVIN